MMITTYLSRRKPMEAAFPCLLVLLAVGYVAYHWSNPVELYPDSGGYLNFSEHRTAGYPVFIMLVSALSGTVDAVPKAQLLIAAWSFAFLGWSFQRAFQSILFALLPVLLLMLYPQIADVHSYILTESLFISLLCLLTGSLALVVRRPTWYWVAAAAFATGLAITIRPAAFSMLMIWPFLFWLIWRRCYTQWLVLAGAAIATIVLCLTVESVVWHSRHDSESRPNLADRHLFAKALIVESEPTLSDPELARLISRGRQVMAPGRELIAAAPSHYARTRLLVDFEVAAQHATYRRVFEPEVNDIARRRGVEDQDVLAQLGLPAMASIPVAWAQNALAHYLGLWFPYWAYVNVAILDEYQAYIDDVESNVLFMDRPIFRHKEPPSPTFRPVLRATLAAGLLVSTLSVGLVVWQRLHRGGCTLDCRIIVAAMCGLAVHAQFLLVGLLGVVATRYAGAMAPLLASCGVLLVSWMMDNTSNVAPRPIVEWVSSRWRAAQ